MPRGKRTRATRSTATGRRTTRAATRSDTTAPLGQVVPITTVQPPLPPAPIPAQTDFTAFLHLIRNEVRAELDAQRVAASTLPVATQSQDPQEPVTSPPHPLGPQQHPSQQIPPTGMSQQHQSLPIAQTLQPPQHYPAQGIGTIFPTTLRGLCR